MAVKKKGVVTWMKSRDEELDWTERSREAFENAMDKSKQMTKGALVTLLVSVICLTGSVGQMGRNRQQASHNRSRGISISYSLRHQCYSWSDGEGPSGRIDA